MVKDLGTTYSEDTVRYVKEQQHQEKCQQKAERRAATLQRNRERQEKLWREEHQPEAKRRRN